MIVTTIILKKYRKRRECTSMTVQFSENGHTLMNSKYYLSMRAR